MLKYISFFAGKIRIYIIKNNLVKIYEQGDYKQALEIADRLRDLTFQKMGDKHPDFAEALNNMAASYERLGDYAEAETLYERALEIIRETQGEKHPDFATCLNNLGNLYNRMGDYVEAQALYERALKIRSLALGENHPLVANSLNNLGVLHKALSNDTKAETFHLQALKIRRKTLPKNHPDLATTLHNLALLYYEFSDYAKAENCLQEALDITRKSQGEKHPEYAASLNSQAMLYEAIANYAGAEPLYRQAIEIQRQTLGEEHPDLATTMQNLAMLYETMGNYADAEDLHCQSLEIRRKTLGDRHPDFAISLGGLAEFYEATGNYAQAEPLLQQALEINRTALGENHPDFGRSLGSLAQLYETMGNYTLAESLCQQAVEILRETLGEEHPDFATSLQDLAEVYFKLGNYALVEPLLQQALEIERTVKGEGHPDFATMLESLASLQAKIGNYAAAEPPYRQAIEIRRTALGEKHPDLGTSLHSLAILYYDMGNYAKAEPLLQQALDIARTTQGEKHPDVAFILNSLALLYESVDKSAEAQQLYQEAVDIVRAALGEEHSLFAMSLNNLAEFYRATGKYAEAEPLYQQVREITRTVLGEKHPSFAIALHNLAGLYKATGNYSEAERLYERERKITADALGEEHPSFAISLRNLATLYVAKERQNEAIELLKQASAINNQTLGQIFSLGSESQRMAYLKTLKSNFDIFLSLIIQYLTGSRAAVLLGLNLVLRRKGMGAEALAAQRDAVLGGRYPALVPRLKELTTLRMQIAQKTLAGAPSPEGLEEHQRVLSEWNAEKEDLEEELARQIPEMNMQQKLQAIDWQEIAKSLPTGTALVEFVRLGAYDFKAVPARGESQWNPARYTAFIFGNDESDRLRVLDLGEAEPIDRKIAKFRATITGETVNRYFETVPMQQIREIADYGTELRKAIFDPLVEAIGTCQQLFLAPDGDLTRLPFEVLPLDNGTRLIDKYRISYLSTGRDVLRFGAVSTKTPNAPLVVADPDFDLNSSITKASKQSDSARGRQSRDLDRSSLRFKPLPGTKVEGEQIAAQLGVKPWMEAEVLESKLKEMRSPRILHLATHGFFLENQKQDPNQERLGLTPIYIDEVSRLSGAGLENPLLRSGLALAGANTWLQNGSLPPEAEDGILTAEDVSGLDLLDTELVVLSACDTGLGEVQTGEGVFGLRRAFVLAGAKTLVMSLWKVPDKQTQELMTDFYGRVLSGQPRADALRSAQLAMKEKYPNPLSWGAFICQGNPSPLPQ